MVAQPRRRRPTFWRDFLGGLAGPNPAVSRMVDEAYEHVSSLVEQAKADVIGRLQSSAAVSPVADQVGLSDNRTVAVVRSMFDAISALVASETGDLATALELYRSIQSLAGDNASGSAAFIALEPYLVPMAFTFTS